MVKDNLIFSSTLKMSHPEPVEGCHTSTKLSMTPLLEQLFNYQTEDSP
jgi:hypothetical protein